MDCTAYGGLRRNVELINEYVLENFERQDIQSAN